MRWRFSVLVVWLMVTPWIAAQTCPRTGWEKGYWSRLAAQPCRENMDLDPVKIPSPDQKQALLIKKEEVFLLSGNGAEQKIFYYARGTEFLWSPDSKLVLMTYCFGAAGPCGAESSVQGSSDFSITDMVRTEFASGHKGDDCYEVANIGGLTWEDGSDKVVVIAEVPPAPSCAEHNEGYFESFVVSLSQRKVVDRYSMQETIHRWRSILGSGLHSDIKLVKEDAKLLR